MKKLILSLVLFSGGLFAQTNTCQFTFNFNQITGFSFQPAPNGFDNRLKGCNAFTMNYQTVGLSAVTVTLQSAGGAGTAGAYGTYSGSVVTGTNPLTSVTSANNQATFSGYVGFLRVIVTGTPTGSTWAINGVVYGALTGGAGSGGASTASCLAGAAASCFVQGADAAGGPPVGLPVTVAGYDGTNLQRLKTDTSGDIQNLPLSTSTALADGVSNTQNLLASNLGLSGTRTFPTLFNGTTSDRDFACKFQAITILAPGTTGKIALNTGSGKKIRICSIHETSGTTSANVTIRSGQSLQCAVGTTTIDALIGTSGFVFDYSARAPLQANAVNDDICMDFSVSITADIFISYAEI